MVKLGFTLFTKGSVEKVFDYFSRFQKIHEWDLNVQSSKIIIQTPNKVGSTYQVVSIYKGKISQLTYQMVQYKKNELIHLKAQNSTIEATDYIQFREKNGGTQINYQADISLRHILVLLTPCVKADFQQLAVNAEKGMKQKCQELFG